jgi:hypothetical protein
MAATAAACLCCSEQDCFLEICTVLGPKVESMHFARPTLEASHQHQSASDASHFLVCLYLCECVCGWQLVQLLLGLLCLRMQSALWIAAILKGKLQGWVELPGSMLLLSAVGAATSTRVRLHIMRVGLVLAAAWLAGLQLLLL